MSAGLVGALGVLLLLLLIFARVPIAISLAASGLAGYAALDGWGLALKMFGRVPFTLASAYSLAAMSFVYPIARGSAPVLVLIASAVALGGHVSALAAAGPICAAPAPAAAPTPAATAAKKKAPAAAPAPAPVLPSLSASQILEKRKCSVRR